LEGINERLLLASRIERRCGGGWSEERREEMEGEAEGYLLKWGESRKARGGHGARFFFMPAVSTFFPFFLSSVWMGSPVTRLLKMDFPVSMG